MEQGLKGQVALVTGGASGIGAAVSRALAAAGAAVVVNYGSGADAAGALVAEITGSGGRALAMEADVGEEGAVAALFAKAGQAFGGLDILVANAGLQRDAPFADMSLADWRAVLDVDLTGQFLCCREAVRTFRRQGQRPASKALGKVVCMGSFHQAIPWAGHANYAASKGGVMLACLSAAGCDASIQFEPPADDDPVGTWFDQDEFISSAKARRLLGWVPHHPGVVDTVAASFAAWQAAQGAAQ